MNAPHEEAVEFSKQSKRENRVYVGNLSYDVKYRDLMEFMRGGGWGNLRSVLRVRVGGGVLRLCGYTCGGVSSFSGWMASLRGWLLMGVFFWGY